MNDHFRGDYCISIDPSRLDLAAICAALDETYWAHGRSRELIARSLENSLCFGLYKYSAQVGLARVITDHATFGYLADVYILREHRGAGLGKWLIETVVAHPDVVTIRRLILATRDAHGLYAQFGFTQLAAPERFMERFIET